MGGRHTLGIREYPVEELLGPLNEVERKNAPRTLYVAGKTSLVARGARVSIVGSRAASEAGLATAHTLAERLVSQGAVVVSGLAAGIDTAAHEATIQCGGRTIAVLGTPLDAVYPAKNRDLQACIMGEYLAISQFRPGTRPRPGNFPMRNRTMALLSDATVIIEAGEESGTLHQGWEALRLGRPLFLWEPLLRNVHLHWPREMARYGAEPLSLDTLDLLLELLPARSGDEAPRLAL